MGKFIYMGILLILWAMPLHAQVLEGRVSDQGGIPLNDAHIRIQGTNVSTATDERGLFKLNLDGITGNSFTLLVTLVGYEAQSFELDRQNVANRVLTITLKETVYQSETVVVTATRTRRDIEEVSIPVTVVSGDEIRNSGSMRLSDILSEQTGMQVVNDHGTGIQVQGFDPDYTLVMIDGNPVIGRTAGTLDLTRVTVRDVEQIEIVKGPSSALWGSDALAGVINIITRKSSDPLSAGLSTRYGENNTLDLNGNMSLNTDQWENDFTLNRYSSGGYKLNPQSVSQTVPEFDNFTLNYKTSLELSDRIRVDADIRYFTESQRNLGSIVGNDNITRILNSDDSRQDFIARPSVHFTPAERVDIRFGWMTSFYKAESEQRFRETGETHNSSEFNQYYNMPELQAGYRWDNRHHSMMGAGAIFESLESERYPSQPDFATRFLFAQHSWTPSRRFELTGGLRFDSHSEYSSQVSPKLSSRYKATDWIQFRASAGRGFKAPEFRQLFLDFTNATAGYSVFGHSTVAQGISRLQQEGTISQVLIPVTSLEEIRAESSWAVNFGFDLDLLDYTRVRVNLFRNNVSNLIETAPVARKTNGQSVFTYFNVDDVFTQGIETELRLNFNRNLTGSLGYQYLDARRKIERDRRVQNDEGEVVERTETSFQPMFNRSTHSGNVKLFYENENGWGANIRGILRGSYGLFDSNGNGFVDDGGETAPGYTVWNLAVSKKIGNMLTVQAGADNLLNHTDINQPYLAGRLWYTQVTVEI